MSKAHGIVAGHGDFAEGMLSALEQITGRGDVFVAVTNRGLSAQGVEELIRQRLDETLAQVIFTDLPAGSCTMAARRIQREQPELKVVTGVNLSTLLDFVFTADSGDENAVEHAADKGRASLVVTGGPRGA